MQYIKLLYLIILLSCNTVRVKLLNHVFLYNRMKYMIIFRHWDWILSRVGYLALVVVFKKS